jgi:hypothetical protein
MAGGRGGRGGERPPAVSGEIRADSLYRLSEVSRRLGWGARSQAQARRDGLRVVLYAKRGYILGADVLAFFKALRDRAGDAVGEQGGGAT